MKIRSVLVLLFLTLFLRGISYAASCEVVAENLAGRISPSLEKTELAETLNSLNASRNRDLPQKFVTKKQAKSAGWTPGKDLWSVGALRGKSIGGDTFGNFEKQLPRGKWREADLDYRGGKRGAKRILFSSDGRRYVTVDHYQTFTEVPPCR
ncbi:MAG TPA: ribonuclease domain-containing protein [Dissulfurispiraceae bacterium]|nr:ribonuclease domain-containing protein [Dissulfurispiraceae bacterium]